MLVYIQAKLVAKSSRGIDCPANICSYGNGPLRDGMPNPPPESKDSEVLTAGRICDVFFSKVKTPSDLQAIFHSFGSTVHTESRYGKHQPKHRTNTGCVQYLHRHVCAHDTAGPGGHSLHLDAARDPFRSPAFPMPFPLSAASTTILTIPAISTTSRPYPRPFRPR